MRRNRRGFSIERESNKMLLISSSIFLLAILSFIITFVLYRNYLKNHVSIAQKEVFEVSSKKQENNEQSSEASSSIGKNVNEMKEISNIQNVEEVNELKENDINTEKIAINISNMEKEKQENVSNKGSNSSVSSKVPDPTFKKPVQGEITNEFAKDTLIYSNTLQEWVTHMRN